MRKLITILLMVVSLGLNAQMITRSMPIRAIPDTNVYETYCTEYQAVYDAMTTPPSAASASAQNTMVESLVNEGYWARMEWFHFYAQDFNTDGEANFDWLNLTTGYDASLVGSPTWTSKQGYTGGSGQYILTGWNPSSNATVSSTNDMTLAIYLRLDVGSASYYDMGCIDGTDQLSLAASYQNSAYTRINTASSVTASNADSRGFYMGTRTSSTAQAIYKNGSSLVSSTSVSSTTTPDVQVGVLIRYLNPGGYTTVNQAAVAFVMDGVNSTEAAEINTIIETCLDAIGSGVQP